MAHYGTLRDYKFENGEDVRGDEVYGVNDEKLGTVKDVIFDHQTGEISYVVLDTGGLLSSRKVMVPINRIQRYGTHEDKLYAELDKQRIEMLPEYDEEALKSPAGWTDYEKRYEERWHEGTVMYNKDTGRIITPPMSEVAGTRTQPLSEKAKQSLQRDFTPQKVGKQDEFFGVGPSGDDVTLRPTKATVAGREDAIRQQQSTSNSSVSNPVTRNSSLEGSRIADQPGLREPGIYKVDAVPEAEKRSDMNEPLNANYGRRWLGFQQNLRKGRDKVVANCPLCGTQDKVA